MLLSRPGYFQTSDTRMKTSFLNERRLPLVVEPEGGASAGGPEALFELWREHGETLRGRLLEHGALLLRGFSMSGAAELERFVRLFSGRDPLDYVGGASPRVKLGEGVYTSTEYPSRLTLLPHNELSYTFRWPAHLFFCCATPPGSGGETPLADSRAVLRKLDPQVCARFRQKGIRYVRNLSGEAGSGYSWQEAFETEDGVAVEEFCRSGQVSFSWRGDGGLRLCEVRPATAKHPLTGEEVWFNQAEGFHPSALDPETYRALTARAGEEGLRLNSFYGDGTPLEAAALEHVREVVGAASMPVAWREGDLLVIDNLLAAHGRNPFDGPRRILLSMA